MFQQPVATVTYLDDTGQKQEMPKEETQLKKRQRGNPYTYPFDYEALTINCATQNDGTIIDYSDSVFFDFKKTDAV